MCGCFYGHVDEEAEIRNEKLSKGLRPSFSAHVRWCEHGAPGRSCGIRRRIEGEGLRYPTSREKQRDVGHPAPGYWLEAELGSARQRLCLECYQFTQIF